MKITKCVVKTPTKYFLVEIKPSLETPLRIFFIFVDNEFSATHFCYIFIF
jgi:hypothetical protein